MNIYIHLYEYYWLFLYHLGEHEIVPASEKKLKFFKKLIFFKNFKTLLFKKKYEENAIIMAVL